MKIHLKDNKIALYDIESDYRQYLFQYDFRVNLKSGRRFVGIIVGIESWLSAEEHMYIIDKVQSPNLKVYYDVANSEKMGYDIYNEIRWLGSKNRICEFHFKENGFLLGKGRIDFKEVKKCMEDIDYRGNIQIEGAIPDGSTMLPSYKLNNQFVRSLLS